MKRPAVFFDRDGVLNEEVGYLYKAEEFHWQKGAVEAIRFLNERGYYVFVVTNQSGVARGFYTEKDVQALHNWMNGELQKQGAKIDAFYYCPHHPEAAIERYRQVCSCRKPLPGMIRQAAEQYEIDFGRSLMIGDRESDVACAKQAGITGRIFSGGDLAIFIRAQCLDLLEEKR